MLLRLSGRWAHSLFERDDALHALVVLFEDFAV